MRITHGQYALAEGVSYTTPDLMYAVTYNDRQLVAHGLFHQRDFRQGAQITKLHGTFITIEVSSPCADVLRIRASHHERPPTAAGEFPLDYTQTQPLHITETADSLLVSSGRLAVRLHKNPWRLDFLDDAGQLCTSSPLQGLGFAELTSGQQFMGEN